LRRWLASHLVQLASAASAQITAGTQADNAALVASAHTCETSYDLAIPTSAAADGSCQRKAS